MAVSKCIVCNHAPVEVAGRIGGLTIRCPICGPYAVSMEMAEDGLDRRIVPQDHRYLVQAWIRWQAVQGLPPPELTNVSGLAAVENAPRYTPVEKMERLLLAYSILCKRPGQICPSSSNGDYPLAYAQDPAECTTYFGWLVAAGLARQLGSGDIFLQREGWQRATELQRRETTSGRMAFVAMWFDDSFDVVWGDGLRPGIRDAGYEAYRMKEDIHTEKIDFRIIAAIRECRFLVAEVSEPRTAVYYEAGFAEGLGKLVIWTCQANREKELSFDTRQYRHVLWRTPEDLRVQLYATIKALLPAVSGTNPPAAGTGG